MKKKFVDNILLITFILSILVISLLTVFMIVKDSSYATDVNQQTKVPKQNLSPDTKIATSASIITNNYEEAASSTGDLPKAVLLFNTLKNSYGRDLTYTYQATHEIIQLGNTTVTEKTEFNPASLTFSTGGGIVRPSSSTKGDIETQDISPLAVAPYETYKNGRNYVPVTRLEFPKSSFNSYLGSSGYIKIYADSTLLTTITPSSPTTTVTINGVSEVCYYYEIPVATQKTARTISFINSAPLIKDTLKTYVHRSISKDLPYTISDIQGFMSIEENIKFYTEMNSSPNVYELSKTVPLSITFADTYTNANLEVVPSSLKVQTGEQDLQLKIKLDTAHENTDVWTNPSFDIVLPEYITAVNQTAQINLDRFYLHSKLGFKSMFNQTK